MTVDYLVIGQGISGTWLSYYLQKEGKSSLVIDKENNTSPSRIAAGIINPVTGRRHATVWMAEEILPFAWQAYSHLGDQLGLKTISQKNIIDFFPSPQMRLSFMERVEEKNQYVHSFTTENHFTHLFNYDFGYGEIRPVYTAHLESILPAWRKILKEKGTLLEEEFDTDQLKSENNGIRYKDIQAGKIIFCDGSDGTHNPYFKPLPFAPNKGESLLLEIPDLPPRKTYKRGMMLVPLASGFWWVGASYEWDYEHPGPTKEFRDKTESLLSSWLKMPFKTADHFAGTRPATLERRPFVGMHPLYPSIGILNGMGTKGCSLSPFFAKQLVDHLLQGTPITPEADVKRFTRILSR